MVYPPLKVIFKVGNSTCSRVSLLNNSIVKKVCLSSNSYFSTHTHPLPPPATHTPCQVRKTFYDYVLFLWITEGNWKLLLSILIIIFALVDSFPLLPFLEMKNIHSPFFVKITPRKFELIQTELPRW